MAVAFDAKATSNIDSATLTATETFTFMTPTAAATALVATTSIAVTTGTCPVCSGMTWNGVTMTLIGSKIDSGGLFAIYVFGLASPATGNHNLVATYTGTLTNVNGAYIDAASFSGTNTTTSLCFPNANVITDNSTPAGTTYPSTAFSVTTASGDMACASINALGFQYAGVASGTLIRTDANNNGQTCWGYNPAVGATTTEQFTGGGSQAAVGVAFRIVQAGTADVLMSQIML